MLAGGTVEEEAAGPPALPTHPPAAASSPRRPPAGTQPPGARAGGGRAVPRSPRWPDCGRRGARGRSSLFGGQRGWVPLPPEK